jgi:hypothetical protein
MMAEQAHSNLLPGPQEKLSMESDFDNGVDVGNISNNVVLPHYRSIRDEEKGGEENSASMNAVTTAGANLLPVRGRRRDWQYVYDEVV